MHSDGGQETPHDGLQDWEALGRRAADIRVRALRRLVARLHEATHC